VSRRLASAVAVAACWLLAPPPALRGQSFRAGVDAVSVDVLVTDRGRPIPGLTAADFELRDNRVLQQITAVKVEEVPVTLALVLDVSESVQGEPLVELRLAVDAAVGALSTRDRATLVTFSQEVTQAVKVTGDFDEVRAAARRVEARGATALYDATLAGLLLRPRIDGRTLMLVFSDGDDTVSWIDPRAVLAAAGRSDVVVYGVALQRPTQRFYDAAAARQDRLEREWFRQHPRAYGRQFLQLLTAETGGALLQAERTRQLRETFARVVDEFKSRYVLMYTPSGVAPDGWHALDVRLKGREGRVTARRGYLRHDQAQRPPR
jgi:Ca-activated chloride channel family protein